MISFLNNEKFALSITTFCIYNFSLSKKVLAVSVYDITGKQLKQFTNNVVKSNNFSVTDLNTGIYFIKIKEENNKVNTKKLIIN